jgi:hypothetical protein
MEDAINEIVCFDSKVKPSERGHLSWKRIFY